MSPGDWRKRLWQRLGVPPADASALDIAWEAPRRMADGTCQRFRFRTGNGGAVPGVLLLPDRPEGPDAPVRPSPAVLYAHAHGNRFETGCDELLTGRPMLLSPYGPALLSRGIASLAIDLAPFGARQSEWPETALSKAAHWRGESLMGRMLSDLSSALDILSARPEIDGRRIATLGLSMGATHAYWLAALRPEIAATAHLCAFADIAPLVATGAHDLHGPYMTVPGLLEDGDMGDVAASIAPRPQLICTGMRDPLTPPAAVRPALDRVRRAYEAAGATASLETVIEPDAGHVESPAMRAAVLAFLRRCLGR